MFGDRRSIGRHPCLGRECAAGRRSRARDGTVDCRRRRRAFVERAIRQRAERYFRAAGRHRRTITRALQITLSGGRCATLCAKGQRRMKRILKARHHQARVTPDSWALAKTLLRVSRRARSGRLALLMWAWASIGWRSRISARSPPLTLFPRRERRLKLRYGLTAHSPRPTRSRQFGGTVRL